MSKNLVIVESPAKAKTIAGFLGKDFVVKSSFGHVRDLKKNKLSIAVDANFEPEYIIPVDKKKVIKELKSIADKAEMVWLASDEDREGEAIAWHLAESLGLVEEKTKRIVFHEITKSAIQEAVNNPRTIDNHLVDAQQARRVLDRLVGYELSPLLWKKVKPSLSAGRVQSVAVRLIVEREREIKGFKAEPFYKITGVFNGQDGQSKSFKLFSEISKRFKEESDAKSVLERAAESEFSVSNIEKKPATSKPSAPFTTSTLQQEASRKLGFSVARTMLVAQQLYESGLITYMRTDSVNLSQTAIEMAKEEIESRYGKEYSKIRQFSTKAKGAQEAHEAIRPSYMNRDSIDGDASQQRLYQLIWKRTIASQMSDARIERTTMKIQGSKMEQEFVAKGEVVQFDGFLKVYQSPDLEENGQGSKTLLPPINIGQSLQYEEILASQRFTKPAVRYSEASLVRKLEELGIGRPSTYAPTISTIQKREYVEKSEIEASERKASRIILVDGEIETQVITEKVGYDKGKLVPTDIGNVVNDFLVKYFDNIINYQFTAKVEKEFDQIAEGDKPWNEMIKLFYTGFHNQITETQENSERFTGQRLLGVDPKSGSNVYARIGRFGPMVQIGEATDEEKPRFASIKEKQSLEDVSLEQALKLFEYPKNIGAIGEDELLVAIGRFGPYIKYQGKFFSIPKTIDHENVTLEEARQIILDKQEQERKKLIKEFAEDDQLKVLNGRYGPYIALGKDNYRIPKSTKPEELNYQDCLALIEAGKDKKKKKTKPKK